MTRTNREVSPAPLLFAGLEPATYGSQDYRSMKAGIDSDAASLTSVKVRAIRTSLVEVRAICGSACPRPHRTA